MTVANKILLVEDDQLLATLLLMEFEQAGFNTIHAQDGWEALERIKENTFDGIVSDIMMPNMDGLQLVHALSSMELNIPIIIISGAASPDIHGILQEKGITHIFIKPLLDEQLNAIFSILGENK